MYGPYTTDNFSLSRCSGINAQHVFRRFAPRSNLGGPQRLGYDNSTCRTNALIYPMPYVPTLQSHPDFSHNPIAFLILPATLARASVTLFPKASPPSLTAYIRTASIRSSARLRLRVSVSSSFFLAVELFGLEKYDNQNCLRNSTEAECVRSSCDNTESGRPGN